MVSLGMGGLLEWPDRKANPFAPSTPEAGEPGFNATPARGNGPAVGNALRGVPRRAERHGGRSLWTLTVKIGKGPVGNGLRAVPCGQELEAPRNGTEAVPYRPPITDFGRQNLSAGILCQAGSSKAYTGPPPANYASNFSMTLPSRNN